MAARGASDVGTRSWWPGSGVGSRARLPAPSTVGELRRAGLACRVAGGARRRAGRPAGACTEANAVWCADFKGQFQTGDGTWGYPLTISDAASRSRLRTQIVPGLDGERIRPLFEAACREFGLPTAIRTDNGPPFASAGLAGLSALAVWWIELGIRPDRGRPAHPQDTGRHERMHRTLKADAASPPSATPRAQQLRLDHFRREYNEDRPHEALGHRPPADLDTPSPRRYSSRLTPPGYPHADLVKRVRPNGTIRWHGRELYVAAPLAGHPIGLTDQGEGRWSLAFGPLILGHLDEQTSRVIPARPPRWTPTDNSTMCHPGRRSDVLPMSSVAQGGEGS